MKAMPVVLLVLAAPSCDDRETGPPDPVTRAALLTIVASPVAGTTATALQDITCPIRLRIEQTDGQTVRGTFERAACAGLLNAAADERGGFVGALRADGEASLVFTPPPLSSAAAVSTSGGCPSAEGAGGPYQGRLDGSALDVTARFRLSCAGLPDPAPPSFEMEYRIATR